MSRNIVLDIIGRDRASAAFESSAASAELAAKRVEGAQARLLAAGSRMTKAITVPVIAAAAASVLVAGHYQKNMALLQTAGGETVQQMAVISAGVKKEAVETGTSLDQLAAGMYTVAKAGATKWSGTEQLIVLKAAAQGAKAEGTDLATMVNALTSVMASYNVPASQAVAVQNELVVAAGKSKTTMQDFASSLSNVIPLASSLHISFAQVGAAIATMTQHGESAQQSTDNLNNLIRNLAGQNSVASAAMQQLGIDTVDLQKSLGTRGLTGTLQIVEDALARNSKGGLVVVNAFKQAQLATGSLNTMLGQMTGDMLKQSQGLLSGATSIKDYRTYAKSLGGEAGAAALQFMGLYLQTQGFNNQLKSGKGDVSTAAAQLSKMLGGATGLNVALMLGGSSAAAFQNNAKLIGDAAKTSGADISTWAKTQQNLAVKADQAKERLEVLAANIGQRLIPIALQVVKVISSVVEWFAHLSTGVQGTIIKVALIAAALGPLITITTRLVRTGTVIVGWGLKLVGAFKGVGTASAVGAAQVERSEAAQTAALETAVAAQIAALNALAAAYARAGEASALNVGKMRASAARSGVASGASVGAGAAAGAGAKVGAAELGAGAAAGAELSGGAAIAAVALPVAALVAGGYVLNKVLNSAADAAGRAMKSFGSALKSLNGQINDVNGALTMNTALTIANNLQSNGMAKKAAAAGISLTQLTEGITGTDAQYAALVQTWKSGGKPSDDTLFALATMHMAYLSAGSAAKKSAADQSAASRAAAQAATDAAAKVKAAAAATYLAAHPAFAAFQAEMQSVNRSTGDVTGKTVAFKSELGALGLTGKTAQTGLADAGTAAGTTADRFKRAAENAIGLAAAQKANGASAEDVAAKLENNVLALEAMATKLGLDKNQVYDLLTAMNLMPSQIDTYFNVNIAAALANIAILKAQLASLGGGGDSESRAQGNKVAGQLGAAAAKAAAAVAAVGSGSTTSSTSGQKISGAGGNTGGGGGGSGSGALDAVQSALGAFTGSLSGTNQDVGNAFVALLKAADKMRHLSSGFVAYLTREDTQLRAEVSKRNAIAVALDAAKSKLTDVINAYNGERSTVSGAISDTFNVSSVQSQFSGGLVTIDDIVHMADSSAANATQFEALLKQLAKEGLNRSLIAQLAAAGPSAMAAAQALAKATPAQLARVNADYSVLSSAASSTGTFMADEMYGAAVQSAKGLVAGLESQQTVLNNAIKKLADGMVAQLKKTLQIHSPSKVFHYLGQMTGSGFAIGYQSQTGAVRDAADAMTAAAMPDPRRGGYASGGGGNDRGRYRDVTFEINGDDARQAARAVATGLGLGGMV